MVSIGSSLTATQTQDRSCPVSGGPLIAATLLDWWSARASFERCGPRAPRRIVRLGIGLVPRSTCRRHGRAENQHFYPMRVREITVHHNHQLLNSPRFMLNRWHRSRNRFEVMKHSPNSFVSLSLATFLALVVHTSTASAQSNQSSTSNQAERDGFRLRGGLSLGGGPFIPFGLPNVQSAGGSGGLAVRLGVQFFHAFGVYVQSTNTLGGIGFQNAAGDVSGLLMVQSQNALLASLTFAHFVEVAAGPSLDYSAYAGCDSASVSCDANKGVSFGVHGRASLNLGGLSGGGPRRTAFNVSADLHPQFFVGHPGGFISLVLGIGVEWY